MKKVFAIAAFLLFSAFPILAQTGTTTITIVAAASLGTITPTPAHFYQSTAAAISLASSTSGFNSSCTATAGSTALPVTYSSTTLALTGTLTAAMTSTLGSLTITITCTPAPLTLLEPDVTLPSGTVGNAYSANLGQLAQVVGGVPPYSFTLSSGTLPAGLALSASSGVVSGVPSGSGSFNFQVTVTDSSGQSLVLRSGSQPA